MKYKYSIDEPDYINANEIETNFDIKTHMEYVLDDICEYEHKHGDEFRDQNSSLDVYIWDDRARRHGYEMEVEYIPSFYICKVIK